MPIKLLYILLSVGLSIFSYAFIDPNLSFLKFAYTEISYSHRLAVTVLYTAFIFGFFLLYVYSYKFIKEKNTVSRLVSIILPVAIIFLFSYPAILSYDIFNYIATAKVLFFYHENPYLVMPIEFLGDPLLQFMHAANKTALYGPSWILLTGVPFFLGFGNFLLTLFNFKLLIIGFYIITTRVMFALTRERRSVALFALHPLVIIETLLSGHNDIVMMFFVLLSLCLIKRNQLVLAVVTFGVSIFIKYASLFLLPVFLWLVWQHLKKKEISWSKVYLVSFFSMLVIFLLTPLREEMYPWYALWFFPFAVLTRRKNIILLTSVLTFGLSLRYLPFMLTGSHEGSTPLVRIIVTGVPVVCMFLYLLYKKQLWSNATLG